MAGFLVNPDDFHTTGDALVQAGGDLHQQWEQLKAQTMGIKFGQTDMVAPLIQMTLMGAIAVADSCFGTSHQALGTYSDGLHTMAKHYQDAEENSATLFKAE
ncbi:MAG TPA: hypothetical protein VEK09_02730 [Jatrophihabitantaceae bacterium]|jgi:hypothetical protein|nr:hypothetical protein [Jatrophihabitantaceae bacterium]